MAAERAETYVRGLEEALGTLELKDRQAGEVVELARAYLRDAKHYLARGDPITAIAAASYAEGLLDALRLLGMASFVWRRPSELAKNLRRVMIAGTFEILHPGHLAYMAEAWRLGYVTAVVASDENASRAKGRRVVVPQEQRLQVVSSIYYVHRAVPGRPGNIFDILDVVRPHLVLLGPDQRVDEDRLREELRRRGLEAEVARMAARAECPLCSTRRIIEAIKAL